MIQTSLFDTPECMRITTKDTRAESHKNIQNHKQGRVYQVLQAIRSIKGEPTYHEIRAWINKNYREIVDGSLTARLNEMRSDENTDDALITYGEPKLYRAPGAKRIQTIVTYKLTPLGREYLRKAK